MFGQTLFHSMKVHKMSATMGAQILAAADVPASGSYIDVSSYERVHIIAHLGALHASDSPTLEPKCSDAVGGTADALDTSNTLRHTPDVDGDDNEFVVWTIEVSSLPTDHHFLTVDIAGTTSNGSYADIFLLGEVKKMPATQTASVLPAASCYYFAGGQVKASAGDAA